MLVWIAVLQYRRRCWFGLLFYSTEKDGRLDCCFTVNKKTVVWMADFTVNKMVVWNAV